RLGIGSSRGAAIGKQAVGYQRHQPVYRDWWSGALQSSQGSYRVSWRVLSSASRLADAVCGSTTDETERPAYASSEARAHYHGHIWPKGLTLRTQNGN